MVGALKSRTFDENETFALGVKLAEELKPGDIISFTGELGAGKTVLIRGICSRLSPAAEVSSPSYTLVNTYPGRGLIVNHVDLYRIEGETELAGLGLDELFESGDITLIEWGEKLEGSIPGNAIKIKIIIIDESTREIEIER
ncbi:MAG: tRNA (adenosine(37)-N6)-threonylcarbamoyltransferase complex ATPase subunit type 1 TsaE [candidate division Zixibacteria bacterium]|nr:tRNA (adenosine(37)-N6)-threonylcarbamoyltransferase complex ATPase subunit type 1 TsaE [candidate division Zixibacteria bacterium]